MQEEQEVKEAQLGGEGGDEDVEGRCSADDSGPLGAGGALWGLEELAEEINIALSMLRR
jgi:hypothetical protein